MKGDLISDQFLMLWFQKDSLDTVGFRTCGGGARVLHQKVTFQVGLPLSERCYNCSQKILHINAIEPQASC